MKTIITKRIHSSAPTRHAHPPSLLLALAFSATAALALKAADSPPVASAASVLPPIVAVSNAAPSATGVSANQPSGSVAPTKASATDGAWKKPAWLTELSLGIREGYDNNVYLSSIEPAYATPGYQNNIPPGGVAALKNHGSWFTTVSPKVGFDFAPLIGDKSSPLQALTLGYAPDFVAYHDAKSESYDIHRLTAGVKVKDDNVSFNLDEAFTYIDGSQYGPSYPGSLNAYGTGNLRERREQVQNRTGTTLQYDQDTWFVRAVGSWLEYDLLTKQLSPTIYPGYQNYPDRYDLNGGADVGYKVVKDFAFTAGYRYGHQYQEKLGANIDPVGLSSSSDYQRFLLGFEGKPLSWLKVKYQGGPDVRSYAASAPVADRSVVDYYGEGSLEATLSPKDLLTFKYKQWEWVSSTGKVPYYDSGFILNYTRKLTDQLTLTLGAQAINSDYNSGLTSLESKGGVTNHRDDWQYTGSAGLRYAITPHFSVDLAYASNFGRTEEDDIRGSQGRNFTDTVVSLGTLYKF